MLKYSTQVERYRPSKIEKKWQKVWKEKGIYQPDLRRAKKPFYNLMMFPYPSAEGMHVGNMYAFTGSDIYGRFKRMQGLDVFEPIGLDGFGIHSENYALEIGEHPVEVAKRTEKNFYRQLQATGNGYAWENKLETYDPDYYKWTQWLFLQMFKHGLAVRKKAPVNWCPSCKTVLSDEQVVAGECERCGTRVVQKELEQWFFQITKYTDRLLKNLEWINWSERIKVMQRNWIGKSEGVEIKFSIPNPPAGRAGSQFSIPVFTTRPDTIYGTTFLALAPEHPIVASLLNSKLKTQNSKIEEIRQYVKAAKEKTELERISERKEKAGVFTGLFVENPLSGEKIPVYITDFVAMGYGTGAIMGVPGHDQRDWDFAKKYGLEIREVVSGGDISKEAYEGEGELVNSGQFNGLHSKEAIAKMTDFAIKKGFGEAKVNYKLRDWCISRQRYWGPPIPMIRCPKCGWVPVPEEDLPVELPYVEDYQPAGIGESPLAQVEEWVNVRCPKCGGPARRETDVSDTFLDSSWYFLRYPSLGSPTSGQAPFDPKITEKWLPVDMYIGGAEHAVLHLMYTRFITMALHDFGYLDFEEPFERFYAHGIITKDGAKMSKSRGNVVIPDEYIKKLGADTLRMYLMFLGPFDQGGDFTDAEIMGVRRFLDRVWRLSLTKVTQKTEAGLERKLHQTIKKVSEDIGILRYNTAIAAMMEFVNQWSVAQGSSRSATQGSSSGLQSAMSAEDVGIFLRLLAPFAPHITEELYQSEHSSIHQQPWPKYDPKLIEEEEVTVVVEVDGKVREKLKLNPPAGGQKSKIKDEVEQLARKSAKVQKHLKGKEVKKVVFVPGKVLNFVTR